MPETSANMPPPPTELETLHRSRGARLPFLALALLLALLIAVFGGMSFQRRVDAFQPLGFDYQPQAGTWLVTAVGEPETGLVTGDQIIRDATITAGISPELLRNQPTTPLVVLRGGVPESVVYTRPPLEIDLSYLVLVAIGIVYLLIGLYTALRDNRLPARLFYFWCLLSASVYILSPILPPQDAATETIALVEQLARTLLPALTLHLFLVFPTSFVRSARARFALGGLYLPATLLLAFHADQIFTDGRFFGTASASTVEWVLQLELWMLVLYSLTAALVVAVRLGRKPLGASAEAAATETAWEERRQLQWILLGTLGGYVPFLVLYVIPHSLDLRWPAWSEAGAVLPLALVPLGFAYAILKYKLWDMGVILRDSIAYSTTVLVGLCGFALIHMAIERGLAQEMVVARNFLTYAAGLVIAGVLVPTKGAISSRLEHFQYRGSLPHRRALGELGEDLLYERDLPRLCTTLIDRLADGLVAHTNLYLVSSGSSLVPVVPAAELPREIDADALGSSLWDRDVASLSPVRLPGEETTDAERLFMAGYRYAFPLLVREHRVGILLVTYKFDQQPLNSEDLELARGLLNQASLAIENAHLLDEVRRRLDEVSRLEKHAKGIIESSPVGIAVLDDGGRIVSANHTFAVLVDSKVGELKGRAIESALPVRPLPRVGDGLSEVSFSDLSGREHYFQLSMAPYELEEQPLRILTVQDTSELVAMEHALKEKERLASLGLLAAGVAHEVNTPLTGISSYAQLLLDDVGPGHQHYEILKKLERQTFRAAQIVNNLLEFSRNRHDELNPVNLASVLGECALMLDERLGEAGVELVWEPPAEPMSVLGHEGELHQVFTNLMVNAIDAMGPLGGGRLAVRLESRADRIVVEVHDTGPGIPTERLERVFQPFFSSKMGKGGTGLGLAITYNIVRRHRGTIRAENHPGGRGCTFTVDLPRHDVH